MPAQRDITTFARPVTSKTRVLCSRPGTKSYIQEYSRQSLASHASLKALVLIKNKSKLFLFKRKCTLISINTNIISTATLEVYKSRCKW